MLCYYIILYYTILYYIILYYIILYYIILYYIIVYYVLLHCIISYCIVLDCIMLCCIVLYWFVLYYLILYYILYYLILYYTILHDIMSHYIAELAKPWTCAGRRCRSPWLPLQGQALDSLDSPQPCHHKKVRSGRWDGCWERKNPGFRKLHPRSSASAGPSRHQPCSGISSIADLRGSRRKSPLCRERTIFCFFWHSFSLSEMAACEGSAKQLFQASAYGCCLDAIDTASIAHVLGTNPGAAQI